MSAFKSSTTTSQDTLKSALSKHLYSGTGPLEARESSRFFVDGKDGRSVMLRGVNLSGSVKMPFSPLLPTHESRDFFKGLCESSLVESSGGQSTNTAKS